MSKISTDEQDRTTHFGNRTVAEAEKAPLVRGVFDTVASRYDLMNDAMSFGLHRLWKNAMVSTLPPLSNLKLLDLAGGTGDIAFRVLTKTPDADITLCDINAAMLQEGKHRAIDRNILQGIEWVAGDAQALPLPDSHFHACTMAFGLRNVTRPSEALKEIYRILKPGGTFLCLEFSPTVTPMMKPFYEWYSHAIIPYMGKKLAGDASPYTYLIESIRKFYTPDQLDDTLRQAGFARISHTPYSGGVVQLHRGVKL